MRREVLTAPRSAGAGDEVRGSGPYGFHVWVPSPVRLLDSVFRAFGIVPHKQSQPFHTPRRMASPIRSQQRSHEVHSVAAFVQQLAVSLVGQGYWFYVAGEIPAGKDAAAVDRKLADRYGVVASKWARARRKAAGLANVRYLRHRRFFVLIATRGEHRFFESEPGFRDIRRYPIKFAGYSIGCALGQDATYHPSVRIERSEFQALKKYFVRLALLRSVSELCELFAALPYEPYAPVRRQLIELLRGVNRQRRQAGAEAVPLGALRLRRRTVRVFGPPPSKTLRS